MFLLLTLFIINFGFISTKTVQLALRENVTLPCPNVKSDVIDQKSLKFNFHELPSNTQSLTNDQLILTDPNGKKTSLRFPGCYQVTISFRLKRPLVNPYIETFMRMGTNLPCQTDEQSIGNNPHATCTNITKPVDWCPQSKNKQMREMLRDKTACRFCNLCEKAKQSSESDQNFVFTDSKTADQQCGTKKLQQTLKFKICTPDRKSMHKMNEDGDGKFDEYWQYLKQGVLNVVMHLADRKMHSKNRHRQCERVCHSLSDNSGRSVSYRKTLINTLNSTCQPKDEYIACIYHTMKFDVIGSLN